MISWRGDDQTDQVLIEICHFSPISLYFKRSSSAIRASHDQEEFTLYLLWSSL
jgi:hypothetical protein